MNKTLLTTLCIALVCALVYLISQNFEYYSEKLDLGWGNEAKINRYLAAQRYLEKQDITVDAMVRLPSEKQLLGADVLLVPTANQIQLESQKRMILSWVENGGTLLIGAGYGDAPPIIDDFKFIKETDDNEIDELRDVILDDNEDAIVEDDSSEQDESGEIKKSTNKNDNEEKKSLAEQWREHNQRIKESLDEIPEKASEEDDKLKCAVADYHCGKTEAPVLGEKDFTSIPVYGGAEAKLDLSSYIVFEHPAFGGGYGDAFVEVNGVSAELKEWFGPERGITYAQLHYGQGKVYIFSHMDFLDNYHIHHFDHAFFIAKILAGKQSLVILFGKDMPSLGQLVYRHFFEALVAGVITIICGLFYFGRRLGKVRVLEISERRSRAERYSAVASFRWQNGDRITLLGSAREQVLKKAGRRWPNFSQWPQGEQIRTLSLHANIPTSAVKSALFEAENFNEHTFTHIIKVLQALRNCL